MAIHHSQRNQAEKLGVTLEERDNLVMAFHPASAVQIFGVSAKDAITQATKYLNIYETDRDIRFVYLNSDPRIGFLRNANTDTVTLEQGTPVEMYKLWGPGKLSWMTQEERDEKANAKYYPQETGETVDDIEETFELHSPSIGEPGYREPIADPAAANAAEPGNGADFAEDPHPKDPPQVAVPPVKRSENGVPLDGAVAYREGITAADCPYSSETEDDEEYVNFERWNEEWDAAADAQSEEDENEKGGSVVASKYRTKYKEEGHPNHCGDWLAELLNNYCVGDKNTDLETFEVICKMNGVDTSKYRREGVGWQGRIRMTGRNLLAKVVFRTGKITVPDASPEATSDRYDIPAPADWLSAQRYSKPDAK